MKTKSWRFAVAATGALLLLGMSSSPSAAFIASTSPDTTGNTAFGITELAGWQFTVDSSILVNALGIWDDSQDGLNLAHDIAIYDDAGPLVASGSISAGSGAVLIANTRWILITPVTLTPGITYDIVATSMCKSPDDGGDRCVAGFGSKTVDYDPLVNQLGTVAENVNVLHDGPYGVSFFGLTGYLGPNFAFLEPGAAVPAPTALVLVAIGLLAGLGFRRTRA